MAPRGTCGRYSCTMDLHCIAIAEDAPMALLMLAICTSGRGRGTGVVDPNPYIPSPEPKNLP